MAGEARGLDPEDLEFIRWLGETGGLSPWQVASIVASYVETGPERGGLLRFVADRGLVDPEVLARLEASDTVVATATTARLGAPSADAPRPFGRYRDLVEIGRGGMGVVYRGVDPALDRPVALKFLRHPSREMVRRFTREARILGLLEHPHIVPVHEFGSDEGDDVFLSMKWVQGRSLAEFLADLRARDGAAGARRERFRLLEQFLKVCDGVAFAHSRGVVHRDLKPGNVMIGSFGEVMVADWGLARRSGDDTEEIAPGDETRFVPAPDPSLTASHAMLGTPLYVAPEQARDAHRADARSDVYSLGATLYELLALEPPFEASSLVTLLETKEAGEIVPPSARAPEAEVPPELDAIALRAMRPDPADRYQSVLELRADLVAWLEGRPVSAVSYSPWVLLWKWIRRHRAVSAVAAAAVLVLSVSTTAYLWSLGRKNRDLDEQNQTLEQRAEELAAAQRSLTSRLAQSQEDRAWASRASDSVLLTATSAAGAVEIEDSPGRRGLAIEAIAELWGVGSVRLGREPRAIALQAEPREVLFAIERGDVVRVGDDGRPVPIPLEGGRSSIVGAFSPDARTLLGFDGPRWVLWDAREGRRLLESEGFPTPLGPPAAWSPDGSRIAFTTAIGGPARAYVADVREARLRGTIEAKEEGVRFEGFAWATSGRLAAATSDGRVLLWDGSVPDRFSEVEGATGAPAWSPDGLRLAVSTGKGVSILQPAAGDPVVVGRAATAFEVAQVAFSPDGRRLAAAGESAFAIWSVERHEPAFLLGRGTDRRVLRLAWSPDARLLALLTDDLGIELWNPRTGVRLASFRTAGGPVYSDLERRLRVALAWSSDGRRLAAIPAPDSHGNVGTAGWWVGPDSRGPEGLLPGSGLPVSHLAWRPDGRTLAVGLGDRIVELRPIEGGPELSIPVPGLEGMAWSADGTRLATREGGDDGRPVARLHDTSSGAEVARVLAAAFAWSPLGAVLAVAVEEGGELRLLDGRDGSIVAALDDPPGDLRTLAWAPDGARLAAGSASNEIVVWDVAGRRRLARLECSTDVDALSWSPDGGRLASASGETVRIWDPSAGRELGRVRQTTGVDRLVWTADGEILVAVGPTGTMAWRTSTLELVHRHGSTYLTTGTHVSSIGPTLVAQELDGSFTVIDLARGVVARAEGKGETSAAGAWSADGRWLAVPWRGTEIAIRSIDTLRGDPACLARLIRDRIGFDPGEQARR